MKTLDIEESYSDNDTILYETEYLKSPRYKYNNFYDYSKPAFDFCKAQGGMIFTLDNFSIPKLKKYIEGSNINTSYCQKDNQILFMSYKNEIYEPWQKYLRYVYYFVESNDLSEKITKFLDLQMKEEAERVKKEKDEFTKFYTDVTTEYKDFIKFDNVNPFKFAIDSSYEDKFYNFSDTLFLIPKEINLDDNNISTIGYYIVLNSKIDLATANFNGSVKMPHKNNFLFMTLDKMDVKDKDGTKNIINIKDYLIRTEVKKGFKIYQLMGIESGRYVSIKILVAKYKKNIDYNICDKNDIEVTQLVNNGTFVFKSCKTYGKKVK
jgi:hypothetical protein